MVKMKNRMPISLGEGKHMNVVESTAYNSCKPTNTISFFPLSVLAANVPGIPSRHRTT